MKKALILLFVACLGQIGYADIPQSPYFVEIISPQPGDTVSPGDLTQDTTSFSTTVKVKFRTNVPSYNGVNLHMSYRSAWVLGNETGELSRRFSLVYYQGDDYDNSRQIHEVDLKLPLLNHSHSSFFIILHENIEPYIVAKDTVEVFYHQPNPDVNEDTLVYGLRSEEPVTPIAVNDVGTIGIIESEAREWRKDEDEFSFPVVPGHHMVAQLYFHRVEWWNPPFPNSPYFPSMQIRVVDEDNNNVTSPDDDWSFHQGAGWKRLSILPASPHAARIVVWLRFGGHGGVFYTIQAKSFPFKLERPGPGPRPGPIASDNPNPDGIVDIEQADNFQAEGSEQQVGLASTQKTAIGAFGIRPLQSAGRAGFEVTLDKPAAYSLSIHDALGRQIARHFSSTANAGTHRVDLANGSVVPTGMYFVTLQSAGKCIAKKVMLAR